MNVLSNQYTPRFLVAITSVYWICAFYILCRQAVHEGTTPPELVSVVCDPGYSTTATGMALDTRPDEQSTVYLMDALRASVALGWPLRVALCA